MKELVKLGLGKVNMELTDDGKVIDFITSKTLKRLSKSPEEPVRQWYEHELVENYARNTGRTSKYQLS